MDKGMDCMGIDDHAALILVIDSVVVGLEQDGWEKACGNQCGIGLPRDKNCSETVHVSGLETATHLGKSHPPKVTWLNFKKKQESV
eukprot:2599576-Ditylum_brightwellii.AAC.1